MPLTAFPFTNPKVEPWDGVELGRGKTEGGRGRRVRRDNETVTEMEIVRKVETETEAETVTGMDTEMEIQKVTETVKQRGTGTESVTNMMNEKEMVK